MQHRMIVNDELRALEDNGSLFVGRKPSVYKKHGVKAAMDIGMVAEKRSDSQGFYSKRILMDSISPHAVFICGMRGSGKSYTLGVIAEELALKNDAVGCIIIDPMGIFWSMKNPNQVEREKSLLERWNLTPTQIDTLRVFIPGGYAKDAPAETWDHIFTIQPPELTADDWCLTFGFDRFDTMGLLIDRVIERVKKGYTTKDGQYRKGLQNYDIEDMILCIESEEGIHSPKQGFKNSTRRALIARLKGALEWGIFDKKGTQLKDLSRRGQISVIDVSFLQDNVRALIVGILARNTLNTRKKVSRKEAVGVSVLVDAVPVTWLMIDEAHILVPGSGRKTAATDALIEYVRQGRQPGCSIVLATQQPSALDSRILSQVDIVICHKLVYEDDIKAVLRRMPSEVPEQFQEHRLIKNLPVGMAIIGDKQEETSRCFLGRIRPRISQHEGRERQPLLDIDPDVIREHVKDMVREKWGKESIEELEKLVQTVNEEYKLGISLSELIDELSEEGALEDTFEDITEREKSPVSLKSPVVTPEPFLEEDTAPPTPEKTPALPVIQPAPLASRVNVVEIPEQPKEIKLKKFRVVLSAIDDQVQEIARKRARRTLFRKDILMGIFKIYYPLYQIFFDYYPSKGAYVSLSCFVDGITGEILLKKGKRTRGVRDLVELTPDQRNVMTTIMKKGRITQSDIMKATHFDKRKVKRITGSLIQKELLQVKKHKELENKKFEVLQPQIQYYIVDDPRRKIQKFLEIHEDHIDDEFVISPVLKKKEAKKAPEIWNRSSVWDTKLVYYPYFVISYEFRYEIIDGVTGKKDDYIKSMLTFRL